MTGTPTFRTWGGILARCTNSSDRGWRRYGGRGIRVCERWLEFEAFLADMGVRPRGLTLDRIDNDGNYAPGNCRWATRKEQSANRRNTAKLTAAGETRPLVDWADALGIPAKTIHTRLARGWSDAKALGAR